VICPPPRAAVAERKGRGLFPLAATGAPCVRALSLARASPRHSPTDHPRDHGEGRSRRRGLSVDGGWRSVVVFDKVARPPSPLFVMSRVASSSNH
jgi:hypothetical protein